MFKIKTLNSIAYQGLKQFSSALYEVGDAVEQPDALILRSFDLQDYPLPSSVRAVARAGVGVNNIPVAALSKRGIPVFKAAGANANAVNELVFAGALLAYRNLPAAIDFVKQLVGDDVSINQQIEQGKKRFVGSELAGRTLGVIGLGAIGVKVANSAKALGLQVIGFDPAVTVGHAWALSSEVQQALSIEQVISHADLVTVHVPLLDATRNLFSAQRIANLKKGAVLLNFARQGIVDEEALLARLDDGHLRAYVTDFPDTRLRQHPKVIALPHLGASTEEAEVNCAVMVGGYLRDYLEKGILRGAVNFPEVVMASNGGFRLAVVNANVPNMVGQITTRLATNNLNILDLVNRSQGELAYTLLEVNAEVSTAALREIRAIAGVLAVTAINPSSSVQVFS